MVKKLLVSAISSIFFTVGSANVAFAQDTSTDENKFELYVADIKKQAAEKGYSEAFIAKTFADIKLYKRAIKADRNQPERVETLDTYLPKRIPDWKVKKARKLYKEHGELLQKVGQEYGVQPRFIVALWGLETNFGSYMGNFNVVSALTTLAYEGRREAFFKKQLWAALTILKEGHIDVDNMKGSWAGAMGQNQFMPTSFLSYAVDGDGDGKKDIWGNQADVFASMANYLKKEGWNDDLTWGRQVKLPEDFNTVCLF